MECGFETNRLQWTHFKFNCSGKFSNSKEYRLAYPTALLVSREVANSTGVTKIKMIEKYGQIDGIARWEQYRNKQAKSNSFEYKRDKYGWTREQFNEFNSSRAQTLEKMIARYGEKQGIYNWAEYCERQAYTNTKEYFIKKYGEEQGNSKYLEVNKRKSDCNSPIEIAAKLNISVDEAVQIILARNKFTGLLWGSNLEREFTEMLEIEIGPLEYSTFTKPYGKWSDALGSYVIFDIKHKDCVIEFNGDYWHANPKIYKDTAMIRGKTAEQIQQRDRLKIQTAVEVGLRVLTVWETDFKVNKQNTIRKVVEWMQNGQP
jgi:hypothetical protein